MTLRRTHRRGVVPLGTIVSAVDTWKRIRQLQAEKFTGAEVSRRLGLRRHGWSDPVAPGHVDHQHCGRTSRSGGAP